MHLLYIPKPLKYNKKVNEKSDSLFKNRREKF